MNRLCTNITMSHRHRLLAVATAPIKSVRTRRLAPLLANVPVGPSDPSSSAVASFALLERCYQQKNRWMATYNNNNNKSKKRRDNGNHHDNHRQKQQQQRQQTQNKNQHHNPPQHGKRGGGNNKKKQIKIRPVFGTFDEQYADEMSDDESSQVTNRNLHDIQKLLEDDFDMDGDGLEYYHERNNGDGNGHWKLLTKGEVDNFRGDVMKVRNPKEFDFDNDYGMDRDDDDDDEDDDDDDEDDDDDDLLGTDEGTTPSLRNSILELVDACKNDGYKRLNTNESPSKGRGSTDEKSASTPKLKNTENGTTVPTREWVVGKSSEDRELLSLLVDNVGALDHIVQCLHLDGVWDGRLSKESRGGGGGRRRQRLDYRKGFAAEEDEEEDDNFWTRAKEGGGDNFWTLK